MFQVFCWLRCLSKWGVGPFKRGSHLSVQGQQSRSGQPHADPLITEKLEEILFTPSVSVGRWTVWCQLLLLSVLYIQEIFFARVINWTIIILQYAHTHTGRSLKWQAGGVAWLFVEKLSITAQKAVTHDRQRIFPWNILQIQNNKLHAFFVLEQQCAVIMHRLSVSAEIISTTGLLKGDERLHLDQQGGPQ